MSTLSKSLKAAAGNAGGDAKNVEDVFSTYLYDGTGSTQTITNGIDLAGEGGMVWTKSRSGRDHYLIDTERGTGKTLTTNNNQAEIISPGNGITSFNNNGYSINNTYYAFNLSSENYASWTFRKAERFFDVVTWTGNEVVGREIPHNLGVAPGMILIKALNGGYSWQVYHKSTGATKHFQLNSTAAVATDSSRWNDTEPTDSVFTLGDNSALNQNTITHVAYLFAHDPVGEDNDGMIACGSYTGNGAGGNAVSLGWEPQYVMLKRSSNIGSWFLFDTLRGFGADTSVNSKVLYADASGAEGSLNSMGLNADGFVLDDGGGYTNGLGETYIYMAIRGPMMVEPESVTEVFDIPTYTGDNTTDRQIDTINPDMTMGRGTPSEVSNIYVQNRLCGMRRLTTLDASAESTPYPYDAYNNNGIVTSQTNSSPKVYYPLVFKRAKGFFDVVAFTGSGSGGVVDHSLGVKPELMVYKARTLGTQDWVVYNETDGANYAMFYNKTDFRESNLQWWNNTEPTATQFTTGSKAFSGNTFIAYLFASAAGVSKCGNYTGNGSSQNIACGFSAGARFVLIKRTDSTGDWFTWDTERGIVAGNDPHLSLNTTAAEVTSDDSIDPQSAGFTVNQVAATNINVSSGEYIFLAIA